MKSIRYFGRELALWRGHDGTARIIERLLRALRRQHGAWRQGLGDLLECPFHAWRYNKTAPWRKSPTPTIPQAKRKDCVPSWPTQETNGFIWMWYHQMGRADVGSVDGR
ncbi:Rieske 2Fe-2S domain-containing protein [Sphingomonas sp. MMS24-JH45]